VFQVLRPGLDIELRGLAAFAVQILATALLAELSYRCIEMPLRSARVPVVDPSAAAKLMLWTPRVALVGALVALVALFTDQPATFAPGALTAGAEKAPTLDSPSENSTTATITEAAPTAAVASSVEPDPAVDASRPESRDVSAFGDSVILGAGNKLHQMMGAVDIDAEVGRQAEALVRRVSERAAAHELAKSVVVHIGTNGFVAERQLRALLDTLRDRDTVVLVNAHAPRRWVIPNNELIARVAPDYPNVRVVDWYHLAQAHPEYFVRDDIHLTGPGLRVFSGAIQAAAAVEPPESLLVARR
jgi:hypothetical protein